MIGLLPLWFLGWIDLIEWRCKALVDKMNFESYELIMESNCCYLYLYFFGMPEIICNHVFPFFHTDHFIWLAVATGATSNESNSGSRKIPGSPYRIPPSPGVERVVPPTPLRAPPSPSRFLLSPQLNRLGSVHLNTSQIIKATQNFSPALRLGEGGFGTVYKALLPDGQVVAVKRAKKVRISLIGCFYFSPPVMISEHFMNFFLI